MRGRGTIVLERRPETRMQRLITLLLVGLLDRQGKVVFTQRLYQKAARATRATVMIHKTMSLLRFFSSAMQEVHQYMLAVSSNSIVSQAPLRPGSPPPACSSCT
jgi:hypothetical protein